MGFLTELFQRSLENPSTPLSAPDDWLFDSLGSFRASSGVNVNRETALTLDAYWRCVALLSGDIGKMPLSIFKRQADGSRLEDENHPAWPLLNLEVSPEISAIEWKRVMGFHALAEGNGYSYIVRNGKGEPIELWPLSPMKTYPVREARKLWYITDPGNGEQRKLASEDVFHLKGLSFDGLIGYAAIAKMRENLGEGLGYANFATVYLRNNGRPNAVLICPNKLKPEAKVNLRESWERMHSGLENQHRTAVLDGGLDIKTIQINARDAQLLDGRRFNRSAIANFFGVPMTKLNERDANSSYNSIEALNEAYVEDGGGLGYWLPAFAIECWRKLTSDWQQQRMTHTVQFNTRRLLRANLQARTTYYIGMIQNGVLCPDEVRAEEGYNPRPDGKGRDFLQPLNMKSAAEEDEEPDDANKEEPKPAPPAKLPKPEAKFLPRPTTPALGPAHVALMTDAIRRLGRRVAHQAGRAARKPAGFLDWLDDLPDDSQARYILEPACRACASLAGADLDPVEVTTSVLAGWRSELLELAGQVQAAELVSAVEALTGRWQHEMPTILRPYVVNLQEKEFTNDRDQDHDASGAGSPDSCGTATE